MQRAGVREGKSVQFCSVTQLCPTLSEPMDHKVEGTRKAEEAAGQRRGKGCRRHPLKGTMSKSVFPVIRGNIRGAGAKVWSDQSRPGSWAPCWLCSK